MKKTFFLFLLKYVFRARSRQRLLVFAFLGLLFASFSLLVIQALMGGLQNGVIKRSKNIEGILTIKRITNLQPKELEQLYGILNRYDAYYTKELVTELLIQSGGRVLPVRLHGIDHQGLIPPFLQHKKWKNLVLPFDFGYRLSLDQGSFVMLISPAEMIYTLNGIPRMAQIKVDHFITTDVPEVDQIDGWIRLSFLQNFLRRQTINVIRVFKAKKLGLLQEELESKFKHSLLLQRWEQTHQDLAWALNLESKIMLALFISVVFLVSISIISGQLIFWSKIKNDLVGMWILGASRRKIFQAALRSFFLLNSLATVLGISCALIALHFFAKYGGNVLPDIFIDRKVPVMITLSSITWSLLTPISISGLFCWYTLKILMRDTDFLQIIKLPQS